MGKTEVNEKASNSGKGTLAEMMAQLTKEVENVLEGVSEEVRQELMDEIVIIRDQFEKKKKQIMEKAKKNAANKTSIITDKIMETMTNKIEQMSTNKISDIFEQADYEIEDLVKLQSASETEVHREISANTIPKGKADTPKENGGKVVETQNNNEIEISTINIDDETGSKQSFDDWFTQ